MNEKELIDKFRAWMKGKTQIQAAKELGISAPYLNDMLHGRRYISSPSILRKLGLRKRIVIEKEK